MLKPGQTICHGGGERFPTSASFIQLVGGTALLGGEARNACVEFCEQNRQIALCSLPESLAELAAVAGFAAVFELVSTYGGRRLYLPTSLQRFLAMTGISIPAVAYQRWRDQADGNGQVDIPSMWGLFLALRRAAIRFALARGWSAEEIYTTFGLSKKQLRAYRSDGPSLSARLS